MKILACDTANNTVSVAVSEGQQILAYLEELKPLVQAEKLVGMIEGALGYSRLNYSDIDYLGVTNGPGSFTGIRIGLAAAKGILFGAQKIKATAITIFEIINFRAITQVASCQQSIVLIDAYRNQLYVQMFHRGNAATNPVLLDYQSVIDLLQRQQLHTICSGSGVVRIYDHIKQLSYITILPRFTRIKSLHLCRYIDLTLNHRTLLSLEPLYIRPPDAKINLSAT